MTTNDRADAIGGRFWALADVSRGPAGCWPWQGFRRGGYGRFQAATRTSVQAHRFAWALLRGPIPEGMELDHLCRNRACVNPSHLEPVTHAENARRGEGARWNLSKTHCPQGHAYDYGWRGERGCRTCRNAASVAYRARKRATA